MIAELIAISTATPKPSTPSATIGIIAPPPSEAPSSAHAPPLSSGPSSRPARLTSTRATIGTTKTPVSTQIMPSSSVASDALPCEPLSPRVSGGGSFSPRIRPSIWLTAAVMPPA